MKTQIAAGQFILGKNAEVTASILMASANMQAILDQVLAGTTVGILINNPVNKKANIAEAQAVVDAMNGMVAKLTADAAKKTKGAGKKVAKNKVKDKPKFESRNAWADAQGQGIGAQKEDVNMDRAHRNSNVGRFQSHAITVAEQRFFDLGEYPVVVTGIEWFATGRKGPVGAMHVQISEGYADVNFYDRVEKKRFWYDFCDFNVNGFEYGRLGDNGEKTNPFNPADGSGELTLPIWSGKNDGQLYVFLPTSEYNGNTYEVLRCRDIRFGKPHSDNNKNLEAALTAYLRFFAGEFVQANPANRHGIDEHCGSCKYNLYVPGYDNMDNEADGYKNTLNTSDTIEMVQWGQEIPRRFCMVHRELVDLEIVKEINEIMATEQTTYYDEEGNLRYVRENEIVMAGKAINKYVALKMGTADLCASCPFYHNNSAKTDKQVSKEKAEGKEYVSKYWSEQARPDRQVIQTLINNGKHEEWISSAPGEVEGALDFRVYGVGGVVIYGSEEVSEVASEGGVLSFIPEMEVEDVIESRAARIIEIIHRTCNNFGTIHENTLRDVENLLTQKPKGLSARMEKRWDGAVARLVSTISGNQGE